MYLNIRSLISNFEELEVLVNEKKPMIIFLSETHITNDINDSELKISGYKLVRCDSHSRHTGGVAIYVQEELSMNIISSQSYNNCTWILSIEIYCKQKLNSGIFSVLYRSPNSSIQYFTTIFEEFCEQFLDMSKINIICGDFNIDLKKNIYSKDIIKCIKELGLKQIVKTPTRVTTTTSTLIDYVLVNDSKISAHVLNTDQISDHLTITIKKENPSEICNTHNSINTFFAYSKNIFQQNLEKIDWGRISAIKNINEQSLNLTNALKESILCFNKTGKIKKKQNNPWYTIHLKELKTTLDQEQNKAMFTKNWLRYKHLRNSYSNELKTAKNLDIQNQLVEYNCDQKRMWKFLKTLLNGKPNITCKEVYFNEVKCEDNKIIAQKFNDYFIDSIVTINKNINISNNNEINLDKVSSRFSFKLISVVDIMEALKTIKCKSDSEKLPAKTLLDALPSCGHILQQIYNKSFSEGIFPDDWKISVIVPVPKISGAKDCIDFRPINMLPTYEKCQELLAKAQIEKFIKDNKILINEQSGYRADHSCETSLNYIIADWKESMDRKKVIIAVFLDFQRAFETLDRDRLLMKLEQYGFSGISNNWFESYLTKRKQKTKFNDGESMVRNNELGVPQGSVLGAILFIIYINDIVKSVKHCRINLFADDTLLFIAADTIAEAENKINSDLKNLSDWLKTNKLKLNVKKTKYIIINQRKNENSVEIRMDNSVLDSVKNIKYLGIVIDNKLNFKDNTDFICKKVAKKIGFLSRIQNKLNFSHKVLIYKSIIAPHFDFCATILFLSKKSEMDRMQKLQNRAMRTILKCNKYTSVDLMLETLQWLSIKQRIYLRTFITIFNLKNKTLPEYLQSNLKYSTHRYNVRNKNDFKLTFTRTTNAQNSLFYKGLKLFNELPDLIKNEKKLNNFKRKCIDFIKINY